MGAVAGSQKVYALYSGPAFQAGEAELGTCCPGIRRMNMEIRDQFHYNKDTGSVPKLIGGEIMKTGGKKSEHMTSLSGNRMVPKTHPRIAFRGIIDVLQAELIEAQVLATELGETEYCDKLGEILDYLRAIMAAEVKETALPPPFLFGMDAEEIHRRSHNTEVKLPPLPSYEQGPLAARINTLRAKVREAELLAVKVFGPTETRASESDRLEPVSYNEAEREDIILGLNRLSSALWWMFCQVTGKRESEN